MSDMMQRPQQSGMPGSMPGQRPSPEGQEAMKNFENNRSILNPTDGAAMRQQGQLRPDMSVGEYMENVFGVRWEDPLQKLIESSKRQLQNRTGIGKAQNLARAGGTPGQQPGGQRPETPGQRPGGQSMGLSDIMRQLGGA